ncbi:hypothetical protein E0Z06_15050 [Rheinheimera sp. D18]|uniref:hypothetical protein n=1 Tax=Rheinheimera sp. D18 TaxID=2545632 RepID=UPI00104B86EE|nr:hypothetical protein [Rheinheimera sp. D18]QBL10743.1 hypothetical protein E0Z06_15050 [Rheinheimera sp. D18]
MDSEEPPNVRVACSGDIDEVVRLMHDAAAWMSAKGTPALRAQLTPSGRGRRHDAAVEPADASANDAPRSPEEKRRSMSWAQRLKRVFSIDVTACVHCGGTVRIVASIEEPAAIRAILGHFVKQGAWEEAHYRPAARAPPVQAA